MCASELAGRPGKQPEGSSKTREVKLCTVWSAEGRDEAGTPVRNADSVTYSAALESAAQRDTDGQPWRLAERVVREATRRGFEQAERRVVLDDGTPWICNLASEHFPDAIQIVDRFQSSSTRRTSPSPSSAPPQAKPVHLDRRGSPDPSQG